MSALKLGSGQDVRARRLDLGLSQAKLAELTGMPQHVLSAVELEKVPLDQVWTPALVEALQDAEGARALVERRKRYRSHAYSAPRRDAKRAALHQRTDENIRYLGLLQALREETSSRRRASAISLFAGCGGLSLGFRRAGFDIRGFVEQDDGLSALYSDNFPEASRLGANIAAMSNADIRSATARIGDVEIIIGGPPCQGFSLSGKRSVADPRNTLFLDYLRFVDVCRPRIAVMENVRLLTSMKSAGGGFVRDEIQQAFAERGYRVGMFELNAKAYGVPQHRERVIFVASRNDIGVALSMPKITHGEENDGDLFDQLTPCRTFADACSDLPYLESGETSQNDPLHAAVMHPDHVIDWLWDVREGSSAHDNADASKRPPSGYNTTYKRQVWAEPGATVQTTFGMISGCRNVHPIATRSLTVREAARL